MNMFKSAAYVIIIYNLIILAVCWANGGPDAQAGCRDGKVIHSITQFSQFSHPIQGNLILIDPFISDEHAKTTWVYCTSDKQGSYYWLNYYYKMIWKC